MPNKEEHLKTAAIAGFILGGLASLARNKGETDFITIVGEMVAEGLITATFTSIGGLLPDILEPATDPNHRKFFHSVAVLLGIGYDQLEQIRKDQGSNIEFWRWLLNKLELGYLVHLLQDSGTPRGLPFM